MLNQERTVKKNCLLAGSSRPAITGRDAVLSVPLFFFAMRLRKMIGPTFSTLRHVRANRSNGNADEMIRDSWGQRPSRHWLLVLR
jgi:hypothetical protein